MCAMVSSLRTGIIAADLQMIVPYVVVVPGSGEW